ncbi:WD repeat-containing protein DDB_G0290555-like [Dioscorea cayenensis subsp. rotundata]|uniref:WD repeat-containing protein DDB_G0290555-like n=1 Tax=Dioscorea cayennensis subsp. rotundata TaxID=55577 RepID=A0AB40C3T1_DIOCR|nr:WD repeat-containing protein DDB_G0290555-like [Dioscorea cayenensis subsp. rotundata]
MPRTTTVECPGYPPLRALTTDVVGLVKVLEVREKVGTPKVVETWGPPDASRSVVAASLADRKTNPLLAVARKNGLVEFLNPLNGNSLATVKVKDSVSSSNSTEDEPVAGLHLLGMKGTEPSSKLNKFLMCTTKGKACLRSVTVGDASPGSSHVDSPSTWNVCGAGSVLCSSVDGNENFALFGGKGVEVNVWDLEKCSKAWTAKSPPSNSLGIFSPTWFTAATFLSKEDHRKIAAGTNNHQVRLYDISAQRRPVLSINFRESPVKVVTEDLDGYTVYIGTGCGDLASFDMRTGKLLGCFVGKCSGSIRSIARHPRLPIIASCGLDSYLRFWDAKTRQLLSTVFLKQHLTSVMLDTHFSAEEIESADQPSDLQANDHSEVENDEELPPKVRSKTSRKKAHNKNKADKSKREAQYDELRDEDEQTTIESADDDDELPATTKRRKPLGGNEKRPKHKKSKKSIG